MTNKYTYQLINPYIQGKIETQINSRNPLSAAKKLYKIVGEYISAPLDKFYMTIQNKDSKEMYHFYLHEYEDAKDQNKLRYELMQFENDFDSASNKQLNQTIKQLRHEDYQAGGKHSSSSSSTSVSLSSSSEEDLFGARMIDRVHILNLPYYKLRMIGLSPSDFKQLTIPQFNIQPMPSITFVNTFYL